MRILIAIFVALLIAVAVGLFLFFGYLQPQDVAEAPAPEAVEPVPAPVTQVEVFTPSRTITPGTILTDALLQTLPVDEQDLTDQMIAADDAGRALLIGAVPVSPLAAGEPIARAAVIQPGTRGFLAAVLPRGKRAFAIDVDMTAGLNGMALPGDRVDLILSYRVAAGAGSYGEQISASETVARNIRLLALDQRTQTTNVDVAEDGTPIPPPPAQTATLEVTPHEAEVIALAATLGELSLSLNSVHDGGDTPAASGAEALAEILRGDGAAEGRLVDTALRRVRPDDGVTRDSDVTTLRRLLADERDAIDPPEIEETVQIVRRARGDTVRLNEEVPQDTPSGPDALPEGPAELPPEAFVD